MLPSDTNKVAEELQRRGISSLTASERLTMALEMSDFVKSLKLSNLRREHPNASERELRLMVVRSCFDPLQLPPQLR